jgi:hypothetical protein
MTLPDQSVSCVARGAPALVKQLHRAILNLPAAYKNPGLASLPSRLAKPQSFAERSLKLKLKMMLVRAEARQPRVPVQHWAQTPLCDSEILNRSFLCRHVEGCARWTESQQMRVGPQRAGNWLAGTEPKHTCSYRRNADKAYGF